MISDYDTLIQFNKQQVTSEMIDFLASTTESIIAVQETRSMIAIALPAPPLTKFIRNLVTHSNVQTPTLMATAVYLAKLRSIIPANVYGMETTRHRIFLGCLILSAKTLNDSSPLNKHWAKYTNGLLSIKEVNTIERELLEYFDWNVIVNTSDLITCLQPLLRTMKDRHTQARRRAQNQNLLCFNSPTSSYHHPTTTMVSPHSYHKKMSSTVSSDSILHSRSDSNYSIPSLASTSSVSSMASRRSKYSLATAQMIPEESPTYMTTKNPYNVPIMDYNKENIGMKSLHSSSSPVKPFMLKNRLVKIKPISSTVDSASNWASSFFN
ncbi:similar to Saccharomyces cerevisiae YDL127W PCL2 Cyclin, interacts with cyclin-dependent kinase Pho85p [Maudiozyma barnettii]|uniref:Similar to Saccharomyces cerevisiae YDL127W PCL2 Cyclin, interacts with cyclin-dependent kinase Pho85p n=1 Tax=Maudiozyma barnettii TaxID=61262 RepID=A0A8H2VBK1_9SACH|nr:cyclin PCL2 [Kazachstania barnettii]CAB4252224.1 similar to Saccharomyces cerevisiae YDL127W PCL2 Cyclin, interacts with cyclin-dependent kinase Pho85p [Kazachstania barnettii]CAD1778867.1 similar to Saccharomyces cerevisiae YDL127W PCL2 Cyclin, interacts with cyclin-dependent kinase Pho85p [Kazachstania barnettii]